MTIDTLPAAPSAPAALAPAFVPSPGLDRLNQTSAALDRLNDWVVAAKNASQLVAPLVDTAFVPDSYRPRIDRNATEEEIAAARQIAVANATAAVLQGITLSLDPLTSLQQIYIVHGRPGMYAKMMVALVQSHGHEVWTEDNGATRAVVAGRRRGSQRIERVTVTMDMARRAGWTRNDTYSKTPEDMLWARAAGRVCDRIASDVIKGLASIEQINDEEVPETAGARTVAPPKRRAAVKATAERGPEPALVDERPQAAAIPARRVVDEPELEPELLDDVPVNDQAPELEPTQPAQVAKPGGRPITEKLSREIHALCTRAGLDRDAKLRFASEVCGREIETTKDLAMVEAARFAVALDRHLAQQEPPAEVER